MKNMIYAAVLLAMIVMFVPAGADEVERAADTFAGAVSKIEGMRCGTKHRSQTIVCIVNASDSDTDRIALFLITKARGMDLPLSGWSLMLANPSDYVVSMNF